MAITDDFLKMTRCPVTFTPLALAGSDLLDRVNRAIDAGTLKNRIGQQPEAPLDEGLVNQNGTLLFPVINGIPCLIAEEALSLVGLGE